MKIDPRKYRLFGQGHKFAKGSAIGGFIMSFMGYIFFGIVPSVFAADTTITDSVQHGDGTDWIIGQDGAVQGLLNKGSEQVPLNGGIAPLDSVVASLPSLGETALQNVTSNTTNTAAMNTMESSSFTTNSSDQTIQTAPESGEGITIQVMKHSCPTLQSQSDLDQAIEGLDQVHAFLKAEMLCPTIALPGDEPPVDSISGPRDTFEFTVNGQQEELSLADATYVPMKLCESDVGIDLNEDGAISPDFCLDASYYEFTNVLPGADGHVVLNETQSPAGSYFGTATATPPEIVPNDDEQSLTSIDPENGEIVIDPASDQDKTVMLHVLNFTDDTGS